MLGLTLKLSTNEKAYRPNSTCAGSFTEFTMTRTQQSVCRGDAAPSTETADSEGFPTLKKKKKKKNVLPN